MEPLRKGERWVWLAVTAALLLTQLRANERSRHRQDAARAALQQELQFTRSKLEAARVSRPAPLALLPEALDWTPEQGEQLRVKLAESLEDQRDLIPHRSETGLSMGFLGAEEVRVIGPTWAVVSFEDGHTSGKALLRYRVGQDGAITWRFLDGYLE